MADELSLQFVMTMSKLLGCLSTKALSGSHRDRFYLCRYEIKLTWRANGVHEPIHGHNSQVMSDRYFGAFCSFRGPVRPAIDHPFYPLIGITLPIGPVRTDRVWARIGMTQSISILSILCHWWRYKASTESRVAADWTVLMIVYIQQRQRQTGSSLQYIMTTVD